MNTQNLKELFQPNIVKYKSLKTKTLNTLSVHAFSVKIGQNLPTWEIKFDGETYLFGFDYTIRTNGHQYTCGYDWEFGITFILKSEIKSYSKLRTYNHIYHAIKNGKSNCCDISESAIKLLKYLNEHPEVNELICNFAFQLICEYMSSNPERIKFTREPKVNWYAPYYNPFIFEFYIYDIIEKEPKRLTTKILTTIFENKN